MGEVVSQSCYEDKCQSVGRPRVARREESPGSMEKRCRIMSGGGDLRESATEKIPPFALAEGKGEKVR